MPAPRADAPRAGPALRAFAAEVWQAYWQLLRLMVPALLLVKALDMLGATLWLGELLGPLMAIVGLPELTGIVWASVLLTNLYTGLVLFFALLPQMALSVAQASVLGTLMLVAHALPVEAAIARAAGVPWHVTLTLRVGGALLLGALLDRVYRLGGWLQQPIDPAWRPQPPADGLGAWLLDQAAVLASILLILAALMALLRMLRAIGVERLLHLALDPLLRLTGIGRQAANITVIGVMLGITFGAGLLLREVRSGAIERRDVWLAMGFLGLAHSLIEDTLLILLIGADLSAILWARLVFAIVVIALLARLPPLRRGAATET